MSEQDQAQFDRGFCGPLEELDAMESRAQWHREANTKVSSFVNRGIDEMQMTMRAMAKVNNEVTEMLAKYRADVRLREQALDIKSSDKR